MQTKLSICIPTYNRAYYLDILLNSILIQYENVRQSLELIVSDNASTDNTSEIVNKYIELGLDVKYLKKDENTGLDGNISNCFINASGEYVWIIGDDDIVVNGAIQLILNFLFQNSYGVLYLSSINYKDTIPNISINLNDIQAEEVDKFKMCKKVNTWFTFVSANIINKNLYLKYRGYSELDKFYGTNVILLSWTYFALIKAEKFLFIKNKLIIAKSNNTGGYKLFETFATNQSRIAAQELEDYPKLIKYIEKGTLLRFFPQWINLYLQDKMSSFTKDSDPFIILRNTYGKYLEFWIFIYPLKFMSNVPRKIFIKVSNLIFKVF